MKKFITELLLFCSICVLIIGSSVLLLHSGIEKKALFKVKPTSSYIILGHSHPECAFNDSLISDFSNYAISAESYFYTFIKIKKILEQNRNVKGFFLEFSNNQIDAEMDDWTWGDVLLSRYYHEYSPFMDAEDNMVIAKRNPSGWLNGIRVSFKKNLVKLLRNDLNYLNGGYLYLVRDKTEFALKNKMGTQKSGFTKTDISFVSLKYLDKIINYCKEKQVNLYLMRSPMHPQCEKYSNETDFINIRLSRYSNTEFLDFSQFPLSNSEFGDLEHLNYRGARKFSIWFNKLIEDGLLNESNKQLVINEKMKQSKQ